MLKGLVVNNAYGINLRPTCKEVAVLKEAEILACREVGILIFVAACTKDAADARQTHAQLRNALKVRVDCADGEPSIQCPAGMPGKRLHCDWFQRATGLLN